MEIALGGQRGARKRPVVWDWDRPEASFPLLPFTFPELQEGEGVWGALSKTHLFADMTFIHEGNHTLVENLINFEKMVSSRRIVICQWSGLGDMTVALEVGEG